MVFECCVPGCSTIAKNGLHSFPSNQLLAQKWIIATKSFHLMDRLNANRLSHSHRKVCKKHFKESDFRPNPDGRSELVKNSIPSLFLPDDPVTGLNFKIVNPLKPLNPIKRLQQNHLVPSRADLNRFTEILPETFETSGRSLKITEFSNIAQKEINDLTKKLNEIEKNNKINDAKVIEYLSKKFNKYLLEFVKMNLKNCGRSKYGRRYSLEQKGFCLAMYKQGPKSYRFKQQFFCLPTKKTLGRYSADLLFNSGVDSTVFKAIKDTVKDWPQNKRYCTISWDEVSLNEHLDYCRSQDFIEGFVEMANSRRPFFATHSLTFMVRGINVQYKQATGYFYTDGLKTFELIELVRLMIESVFETGLEPILSVCDQASTNASTVNALVNPICPSRGQGGKLLIYKIKGHNVIHCFDPSHLIKTARNNLQTKNLAHFIGKRWHIDDHDNNNTGPLQIASWDHILALYRMDFKSTQRRLPKLTDEHLNPKKLKMKVSLATQVFSQTCGSVMLRCIQRKELPEYCSGTAKLLFFMNDVFDSLNGSEHKQDNTLKGAVQANSIHFAFWEYALEILPKMYFIDKVTGETNNRSSVLKKIESTIRGYLEFSKICHEFGIPKVSISNTSQDGLENFFGRVKSCGQVHKPTSTQYRTGYATMTINNITGTNYLRSNCQPDTSTSLLTNILQFIVNDKTQSNNTTEEVSINIDVDGKIVPDLEWDGEDDIIVFDPESDDEEVNIIEAQAVSSDIYVHAQSDEEDVNVVDIEEDKDFHFASEEEFNFLENEAILRASNSICRKLIKFASCEGCKNHLQQAAEDDTFTKTEITFVQNCEKVLSVLNNIIPNVCSEKHLKKNLLSHIESVRLELEPIGCPEHNDQMTQKMQDLCAQLTITTFCCDINNILSGKTETLPANHNHIQKRAYDLRKGKKKIGKFIDIFNNH